MKNVGLNSDGISAFAKGLGSNASLEHLEIGGNEVETLDNLVQLVVAGTEHPKLRFFDLTNSKGEFRHRTNMKEISISSR